MEYIVASHSFLAAVDLDQNWNINNFKLLDTGYHFGITIVDQPAHRDLIVYRGGSSVQEQTEKRFLIYRIGEESIEQIDQIIIDGKYGDIHQISSANNGLYITNTQFNSIVYHNFEDGIKHEYIFEEKTYDYNHVNSIFICGAQCFVLLHNRANKESELVLLEHDLKDGFKLKHEFSLWNIGCHNVYLSEDQLVYNASQSHELVMVDLLDSQNKRKINFGEEHSKGLSVTDDYFVVGLSEHTFRDKRSTARGRLGIVKRTPFELVTTVDLNLTLLPHPIGNINEVVCISQEELGFGRENIVDLNWRELKFAKSAPIAHLFTRMKTKSIRPIRRLSRYLR